MRPPRRSGCLLTAGFITTIYLIYVLYLEWEPPRASDTHRWLGNTIRHSKSFHNFTCVTSKTTKPFKACIHNTEDDKFISKSIKDSGIWDINMTQKLLKIFRAIDDTNVTFIDVGANIGYFSFLAASYGHHVIAIEPLEANLRLFETAIEMNDFSDKIVVIPWVASNTQKKQRLFTPKDNKGGTRIVTSGEHHVEGDSELQYSDSMFLDEIIPYVKTRNVVIKIDTEGHECRVLQKSSKLLQQFQVKAVVTEWFKMVMLRHLAAIACPPREITNAGMFLSAHGFIPVAETSRTLDPRDSDTWRYDDVYWLSDDIAKIVL